MGLYFFNLLYYIPKYTGTIGAVTQSETFHASCCLYQQQSHQLGKCPLNVQVQTRTVSLAQQHRVSPVSLVFSLMPF